MLPSRAEFPKRGCWFNGVEKPRPRTRWTGGSSDRPPVALAPHAPCYKAQPVVAEPVGAQQQVEGLTVLLESGDEGFIEQAIELIRLLKNPQVVRRLIAASSIDEEGALIAGPPFVGDEHTQPLLTYALLVCLCLAPDNRKVPASLRRSALDRLRIKDHNLKSLPPEIGQLENLRSLRVDGYAFHTLPASLGELQKLRSLDLRDNRLRHDSLTVLAHMENLRKMRSLNLANNPLGAQGATALSRAKALKNLRWLNLGSCDLRAEGVEALVSAHPFKKLEHLELQNNYAADGGAKAIARAKHFDHLRALNLSGNHIGPQGALALSLAAHLDALNALDLSDNAIDDDGVTALVESKRFHQLQHLDLRDNKFGVRGAKALSKAKHLAQLQTLLLGDLGEESAALIRNAPALKKIPNVDLGAAAS